MKRVMCLLLALVMTALLCNCTPHDSTTNSTFTNLEAPPATSHSSTSSSTSLPPSTSPATSSSHTQPSTAPSTDIPVFTEEALAGQPTPISEEEQQALNAELEAILSTKNYSDTALELIHSTVQHLYTYYPNFESLFAFLNPPDTATYIRNYILRPLDLMVDELECTVSEVGGGRSDDVNHKVTIRITADPSTNAMSLVHELHHMTVCIEHGDTSSAIYYMLMEGSATLHELTLIGSPVLDSLQGAFRGSKMYSDSENEHFYLKVGNHGTSAYALYSSIWFKLFALTDYATMEHFLSANGEAQIRQEMVERYDQDGAELYDLLKKATTLTFDEAIRAESLFLKLFLYRLNEIKSPEQMYAYLQLYRIFRLVYGSEYIQRVIYQDAYGGNAASTSEHPHPLLDFAGADTRIADCILTWNILNTGDASDSYRYALARKLASRSEAPDHRAYNLRWLFEISQPFVLTGARHFPRNGNDVSIFFPWGE